MTEFPSTLKANDNRHPLSRNPVTSVPFLILVAFSLTLIFLVIPFYNWWYRIFLSIFGSILLFLSPLAVLILLVNTLYLRQGRKLILIVAWTLAIFLTWKYILPLRKPITAGIIQQVYCRENHPGKGETVLGGIKHIDYIFVNDSHCIFPACNEEFYYCDK
jgi:hypothetical protein